MKKKLKQVPVHPTVVPGLADKVSLDIRSGKIGEILIEIIIDSWNFFWHVMKIKGLN